MSGPAVLAEVRRGGVLECVVRGHVAVVDAAGRLTAGAGDPDALLPLRSAVKPLQALTFLRSGACDALGAGDDALALACASHGGEPEHVAVARSLLARAGLDDNALACGPQPPAHLPAALALAAAGGQPGRIHNNCSGKHAAMLATCLHVGLDVAGYTAPTHPLQARVRGALEEHLGLALGPAPVGVDGCGLPTYGVPLRSLATAFASASAHDSDFRRCQAAMAAHPSLVGGTGRFDSVLLRDHGARLTAKSGGAACWAAVAREGDGVAVAVKLEAGAGEWLPAVAVGALRALDLLPTTLSPELEAHGRGLLRNWAGAVVGETLTTVALSRR